MTYHKRRNKNIEIGQTDSNMIHDDRTIAKDMTVDSKKVRSIDACQDKNKEPVRQRRQMLKIRLFGKDSHINVTEILVSCFWHSLKDLVNGSPLLPNCVFY